MKVDTLGLSKTGFTLIRNLLRDGPEDGVKAADISEKFLSAVENGRERNLSVRYLMSISIALGVPFEGIISRQE